MWFIFGAQIGMIAAWIIAREYPNLSDWWMVLVSGIMAFILGANSLIEIGGN